MALVLAFSSLAQGMVMPDTSGNSPNANLSLGDYNCTDESCKAFLDAENESQASIAFAFQFEYGHWTVYYALAVLGVLMAFRIGRHVSDKLSFKSRLTRTSILQRIVAGGRWVAYRRFTSKWISWLGLPAFGMLAFLLTTCVFLAALTFAVKPYYREHLGFGSPPIATRTGLMAFACTPLLIALAGKANFVTLLTGISYERLNVVHRWVAWMSLFLSMIHGFPFIVQAAWDAPFYHVSTAENVKTQFYLWGTTIGASQYSGVPPFAILLALCVSSLPQIRDRFYESFYWTHVLLAITYLGLLFWHALNILDSWAYLWATLALWSSSYLARLFWYTRPMNIKNQWFVGSPTTTLTLPGGMTKLSVISPPDFYYSPSQHCFVRIPAISLWDNHPFTIMSVSCLKRNRHLGSLSFLVRTHSGFTQSLATYAATNPDIQATVWIDGPYGGLNRPIECLYDTVVLIAGGGGISACISWLTYLTKLESVNKTKRIVLVWAVKHTDHFAWVKSELDAARSSKTSALEVNLYFHVTEPDEASSPEFRSASSNQKERYEEPVAVEVAGSEKFVGLGSTRIADMAKLGEVAFGRPVMNQVIQGFVGEGKTVVVGCGPESLRNDISNSCAAAQRRVLSGEIQELAMHLEHFGW